VRSGGHVPDGASADVSWQAAARELFGDRLDLAVRYAEHLSGSGVERGLLGPREVPRLWDRHLLNSAAVAELVPDRADLADVGSGAGLPGLPLAIARPDITVRLVEPLLRRSTWLDEVVSELGLTNVEVLRARAEELAGRIAVQVVSARAVAPLARLCELCLPLLAPGGVLLALKGRQAEAEVAEAAGALKALGARRWWVESCGQGVLAVPTTVVVVATGNGGQGRRSGSLRR
jgi:16S rRNA (guanine527-N7)-methyltransferase